MADSHDKPDSLSLSSIAYERDDLIRILNQSLRALGFANIADQLEEQSHISVEPRAVIDFREALQRGHWDEACDIVDSLASRKEAMDLTEVKFLLCREKFLELLESGQTRDALVCLQREVTPRSQDPQALHQLGLALVLDISEAKTLLGWAGHGSNRTQLLRRLEGGPCAAWLLPPHRLDDLLRQALQAQRATCLFHNSTQSVMSLLYDHSCSRSALPHETIATLALHTDEVWFVRFSHRGDRLATCSKDGRCILWSTATRLPLLTLHGHSAEVELCDWSPNDALLLTCGGRLDKRVHLWDTQSGVALQRLGGHDQAVTAVAWAPDGKLFLSASVDQHINIWDAESLSVVHTWAPLRATSMAVTVRGRVVVFCYEHKLHVYDLAQRQLLFSRPESQSVTSVCVSRDGGEALVGLLNGELHLWSIEGTIALLQTFSGPSNGHYILRGCFGGAGEDFVVSGSEDGHIFIWHRRSGKLLDVLAGHRGSVNAVAWSSSNACLMASASDDGTVRLWGPADHDTQHPHPGPEREGSDTANGNGASTDHARKRLHSP